MLSEFSRKLPDVVLETCQTGKEACGLTSWSKARLKGYGNFEDVWGSGDLLQADSRSTSMANRRWFLKHDVTASENGGFKKI
jgi:hypothetical protein